MAPSRQTASVKWMKSRILQNVWTDIRSETMSMADLLPSAKVSAPEKRARTRHDQFCTVKPIQRPKLKTEDLIQIAHEARSAELECAIDRRCGVRRGLGIHGVYHVS